MLVFDILFGKSDFSLSTQDAPPLTEIPTTSVACGLCRAPPLLPEIFISVCLVTWLRRGKCRRKLVPIIIIISETIF